MTRAVVFDLFGTLVQVHLDRLPEVDVGEGPRRTTLGSLHEVVSARRPLSLAAFVAAVRAADAAFADARRARGLETRTQERFTRVLAELGLDDPELVDRMTRTHMGWLTRVTSTPDHHADVLRRLHGAHRLGLCSNFSHTPTAVEVLRRGALLDHLDALAVSADVGVLKPRAEIFGAVLADLGVEPADAVHVGDRLDADVAGAADVGMRTVWLTRDVTDVERARKDHAGPEPDHVIADLAELEDILR